MQIDLGKIESSDWYINKAFARGKNKVSLTKIKTRMKKDEKYKFLESIRLSVINDTLRSDLGKLVQIFPKYEELDIFYKEIFSCFIDVDKYKHSFGKLNWAAKQIQAIYKQNNKLLHRKTDSKSILEIRNIYLARVHSVLNQISNAFEYLEYTRKRIKDLPNVKTSMYTVAIAGFPNVGKSTLLSKITDSKPEINSYAFTTKGLMIGYLKSDGLSTKKKKKSKIYDDDLINADVVSKVNNGKIQVIDTPGSLNRFEKMNNIEKMAHLCIKHVAHIIVYVFDFTEPYSITEQIKLYQDLKKINKDIIVYFSKTDIVGTKLIDGFEVKGIYNTEELKQQLVSHSLNFQS
ncbi:MAG: GTPase [Candidatus Woesearchaeota archaeon]